MLYGHQPRILAVHRFHALRLPRRRPRRRFFSRVQTRFNGWLRFEPEFYYGGSYQLAQGIFGQASGDS